LQIAAFCQAGRYSTELHSDSPRSDLADETASLPGARALPWMLVMNLASKDELGLSAGGGERYKLWKQLPFETMKWGIVDPPSAAQTYKRTGPATALMYLG